MTHHSFRVRLGALAAVAALALVGCGTSGGEDDADDTTTTAAAEADETTTTASDDEADDDEPTDDDAQARAEIVTIGVEDFGEDGWSASPPSDEESPISDCDPSFQDDSDELAEFTNDEFLYGDVDALAFIQMAVETKVFVDEAAAEAAIAPFSDEEVLSCIEDGLIEQLGSGGAEVQGEFGPDTYDDALTDEAVAASGEFTVSGDGETAELQLAVGLVRTGDVATQILIYGTSAELEEVGLGEIITRVEELTNEAGNA